MPEVAVAFTVSAQREKYLIAALESWARVRGVQDAGMIFCIEPHRSFPLKDFTGWAQRTFRHAVVASNPEVLGCLKNTRQAFDAAFSLGARLAVMAEEDLVVATDILEYLAWAMETYEDDQEIVTVSGHVKDSQGTDSHAVVRAPWMSPLVCGTWKDRWENFIKPGWKGWSAGPWDNPDTSQAWDTNLRMMVQENGKASIFPVRSRVLHIGEYSTWMAPATSEFLYGDTQSCCYAPDYPPGSYHEVPFGSVPGLRV